MTAVAFDNATDGWLRTTDLLDTDAAYTFMFWVYITTDRNDFSTFWSTNAGGYSHSDWIGTDADGVTLQLYSQAGGGGVTNNGSTLTVGTWYHIAMVRSSTTSLTVYLNGVSDASNTVDVSGRIDATRQEFAGTAGSDPGFIRIAYVKAWSTNLSAAEIVTEMNLIRPNRLTNLYGWWPTWSGSGERIKDYSGNGRNWTESGTLTEETPPPVSYGASNTFVTYSGAAPQIGTAISDVSDGTWTTDTGGTSLFGSIDETVASDADYIQSALAPSADICEVQLTSLSDPVSSSGHIVRYRYDKTPSDGRQINLTVRLRQGAGTTIATWTHTNIANGFVTAEQTLSGAEADAISNYADLRLRFEATQV